MWGLSVTLGKFLTGDILRDKVEGWASIQGPVVVTGGLVKNLILLFAELFLLEL